MLNAQLTPDYVIQSDANAQNFVIKRRRIVDPTQAPGYKAVEGNAVPPKREVWDDAAYYPVNTEGLRAALDYVRFHAAVNADTASLSEFMAALHTETLAIESALDSQLPYWPDVTVEITGKKRAISPEDAA
ncbi:hypothetical protein BSK66_07710 [Paenibacillus odorifer]|uniref:Uncharacterized protein n=1 Tax=Paenibacillus odorifer TaxID=189426 RepID=A0A1R0X2V2_9BACL|nr:MULTISPECIES: hypothetical protein [Paenibacillus]ETT64888.1 hypothetical protein C171_07727 [Paenibacillus sp. FSL H8-237]OMD27445.1 hypothetical protein BJP51_24940 [Paenibacillus odorifer]OME61007.1 hypothetical protein BSK66_07710 [Paenibacillus odorifer]